MQALLEKLASIVAETQQAIQQRSHFGADNILKKMLHAEANLTITELNKLLANINQDRQTEDDNAVDCSVPTKHARLASTHTQADEAAILGQIEGFLAHRWQRIKQSCASYTSQHDAPITKCCYDIATQLHQFQTEQGSSIYERMMPGLSMKDAKDHMLLVHPTIEEYDLDQLIESTHENNTFCLIPVHETIGIMHLCDISETNPRPLNICNSKGLTLTADEYKRLMLHSQTSQALSRIIALNTLHHGKNSDSFFVQVKHLMHRLLSGSVDAVEAGTEVAASETANIYVTHFLSCFESLSEATKAKIRDTRLTTAITSVTFGEVLDWLKQPHYCVAITASQLDEFLRDTDCATTFSNIRLDADKLPNLSDVGYEEEFKRLKRLITSPPSNQKTDTAKPIPRYQGRDPLGVTWSLINHCPALFNNPQHFSSILRLASADARLKMLEHAALPEKLADFCQDCVKLLDGPEEINLWIGRYLENKAYLIKRSAYFSFYRQKALSTNFLENHYSNCVYRREI